jgi:GH15 family glucan-1,4-alpha-glucosidase
MDLFSSARWLTRPFRFEPGARGDDLPIDARAVIGDGVTCALVRVDGVIDWLCLPRFDSPSVFAGILDARRGGSTGITPVARPFESLQRYDPDTNVLETLFQVEGQGVVRLTDYMPWTGDARAEIHEVHRRVECVEGEVALEVTFDPRFGYGASGTILEVSPEGVTARGDGGERLVAVVSGGPAWSAPGPPGVSARLLLRRGERRWMVLSWDVARPEPIAAYRPFEHLRATRQAWRKWAGQLQYDGPWRHHVLRSALVLKLLIYAPTGAMVAAPTTSLPEWPGGQRNWDYRYAWSRDAAMAIRANNLIGYGHEAREFFHFLRETLAHDHTLQVMYQVDGRPVPEERVLGHLAGALGASPVRVGNGARDQLQLDTAGAVLDAAHLYELFGGHLGLRTWSLLRTVTETVRARWREPDHGIWEPRCGEVHNVHSKLMCWQALRRGERLAHLFGHSTLGAGWRAEAERICADLLANGLDPGRKHFVSAYGHTHVDAALLLLPIAGLLPGDHPLVEGTVARIRAELGEGPFVHRYRVDDGVGGPEGAFILCGFWLAEALALAGRLDEAQEVFVAHAEAANHVGLLAEEYDPRTRMQLGNFPQAFSHLGLINAAVRIDLGLRQQDEGISGPPRPIDFDRAVSKG